MICTGLGGVVPGTSVAKEACVDVKKNIPDSRRDVIALDARAPPFACVVLPLGIFFVAVVRPALPSMLVCAAPVLFCVLPYARLAWEARSCHFHCFEKMLPATIGNEVSTIESIDVPELV
eukprot:scaffold93062_cov79-Cyclotella_meneghiniana.AAC.1